MKTIQMKSDFTADEAADILRVSKATVWRLIREGKLTTYRVGGNSRRIHRESLLALRGQSDE